jgi:enoyl-CoA hydratase
MTTQSDGVVLTERRGNVLIVTINRPEARNACNLAVAKGISEAMDLIDGDDDLFLGILTGAGGNFSAGADLKATSRGERPVTERGGFGMFSRPPRKPMIAAVEGYAVGGGFELCLSCDLIVASRTAQMGLPEVRHNLIAIGGALFRLPKRMPYHIAMELALTGKPRPAEFFEKYGVVNRLVAPGQALDAALSFADELLVSGPTALSASKEIIFQGGNWTEEEAWERQVPFAQEAMNAEDRQEGLIAFAEKRKPVWKGR